MKFDYVLGNPPYQEENNNNKLYPAFYLETQKIGVSLSLIFPSIWQEYKRARGLELLNTKEVKEDRQIVAIDNRDDAFPGVAGATDVNVIVWKRGYDNELNGKQKIYKNGKDPTITQLIYDLDQIKKPQELYTLQACVNVEKSLNDIISRRMPYGFETYIGRDAVDGITAKQSVNTEFILHCSNKQLYVNKNYKLPKYTGNEMTYKIFIPNTWGNMSEQFLGGSYANIYIAPPKYICSATFIEYGGFSNLIQAHIAAKYLMTKFCRALLFINKTTILCSGKWSAVPAQDFYENWWNESIDNIDEHLFDKYKVPEHIRQFVKEHIQPRTEENIIDLSKAL